MHQDSLTDLYLSQLRDLYSAEQQLIVALPLMAGAATSPALRRTFERHLKHTQDHAQRLEQIFRALEQAPEGNTCAAMQGLIAEGQEVLAERNPDVRDAALIAAAQRVEHHEIAGYGTVATCAALLGETDAEQLLRVCLHEESQTDTALTDLAGRINVEAMGAT